MSPTRGGPPQLARRLAVLRLPAQDRDAVLGELDELFQLRRQSDGLPQARRWYWRQALRFPLLRLCKQLRSRRRLYPPRRGRIKRMESLMESLWQELRLTVRSLSRNLGLASVVVLTLALAIGANSAIFSLLHSALLEPLPYRDPSRLMRIYSDSPPYQWPFSVADYLALEEQQEHFSELAAYTTSGVTLSGDGQAERLRAQPATAGYFSILGLEAHLGRTFRPGEDRPEAPLSVVLSHGFWQRRLGGDGQVLGRTLKLDGQLYSVIGVMPPLEGPIEGRAELWPIFQLQPPSRKGPFFLTVLGRLKPEAAPQEALQQLRAINQRIFPIWQETYQDQRTSWGLQPLSNHVTGNAGTILAVLLAAVGFVLLVACANIANLMLVRASSRRRELALRSALGASRGRLLRLFLSESLLLALLGGLLGLALGAWLLQALQSAGVAGLPRLEEASLSWPVLGFTAAVSILCGLFFGALPAIQPGRSGLAEELRSQGRQFSGGPSQRRLRSALVALEVALALPLLIGAGLMGNSLLRLLRVDPGFDTQNLLSMHLYLAPSFSQAPEDLLAFWEEALRQLNGHPGVELAAGSSSLPPDQARENNNFDLEELPTPAGQSQPVAPFMAVTPEYFETLGIPLLEGRQIEQRDNGEAPPVAVVALAWAERFFPGQSALGKRFKSGGCSSCPWSTIVGVVGDVKYTGLDREEGAIYVPFLQSPYRSMFLTLRTAGPAPQIERPARQIIAGLAPEVAPSDVRTMQERLSASLSRPRHLTVLVGGFAALALLLALLGIYGVLSWLVNQDRKEIGIRLALGGPQRRLFWSVVGRGMRWAAAGLLTGLLAALALSRFLDGLLYGVGTADAATYTGVTACLVIISLLACSLPARRATRVDPVTILKAE